MGNAGLDSPPEPRGAVPTPQSSARYLDTEAGWGQVSGGSEPLAERAQALHCLSCSHIRTICPGGPISELPARRSPGAPCNFTSFPGSTKIPNHSMPRPLQLYPETLPAPPTPAPRFPSSGPHDHQACCTPSPPHRSPCSTRQHSPPPGPPPSLCPSPASGPLHCLLEGHLYPGPILRACPDRKSVV